MIKRIIYILCLISLFCVDSLYAQKEGFNWTFGNGAGLTWNTTRSFYNARKWNSSTGTFSGYVPLANMPSNLSPSPSIVTYEGCFALSDPETGRLLFYSDGMNIWNKDGSVMATGLGGHRSSTQSGVIMPYPGVENKNKYIVLSLGLNTTSSRVNYAVVDMNDENGNLAETGTVLQKNITLEPITDSGSSVSVFGESMAVVPHANKKDFWIVSPGKGEGNNSAFYAWKVTKDGVDRTNPEKTILPVNTPVTLLRGTGYFRFSPDGKYFAWATSSALTANAGMYIGNFNAATGRFSNIKRHETVGTPEYGIEFSASGRYLYVLSAARIRVFDFPALLSYSAGNNVSGYTPTANYGISETVSGVKYAPGALQLGPDGYIYATYYNLQQPAPNDDNVSDFKGSSKHMIVITNPERASNHDIYKLEGFLTGEGHVGITSFSSAWFAIGIRGPAEICSGTAGNYSLTVSRNAIDNNNLTRTVWSFNDGSASVPLNITSTEVILSHKAFVNTTQANKTVTITVDIYNSSNVLFATETYGVTVFPAPEISVSVPDVCVGNSETMTANVTAGTTVNWYNDTDETPIHTGLTCSTGQQNTIGTVRFYAEAVNAGGCSTKIPVDVTVKACATFIPVNPHLRSFYK